VVCSFVVLIQDGVRRRSLLIHMHVTSSRFTLEREIEKLKLLAQCVDNVLQNGVSPESPGSVRTYRTRNFTPRPNIGNLFPRSPLRNLGVTPDAQIVHELS